MKELLLLLILFSSFNSFALEISEESQNRINTAKKICGYDKLERFDFSEEIQKSKYICYTTVISKLYTENTENLQNTAYNSWVLNIIDELIDFGNEDLFLKGYTVYTLELQNLQALSVR